MDSLLKEKTIPEINNEDVLTVLNRIDQTNQEILVLNQQIASSNEYLKRYFRFRLIANLIKWLVLIVVLILGFISLHSVFDYLRQNIDLYENKVNQVVDYK